MSAGRRSPDNFIGLDEVYDRITAATNRLTDHSIDPFDGTNGSDIEDWLRRYENLATARRWDDIAKKEQLPTFFTGTAARWLQFRQEQLFPNPYSKPPATFETPWPKLTWAQVKTTLTRHYLPDDYHEFLRARLNERQKRNQDLVSFFDDKVFIAGRLGMPDEKIMRSIRCALLPEYQNLMGTARSFDLDEFLERLKEADIIYRSNERRRPERTAREETRPAPQIRNVAPQRQAVNSRRCYNCQGVGHLSRDCRAPQYIRDQRRNFQPPYNQRAYNQANWNQAPAMPHASGQAYQPYQQGSHAYMEGQGHGRGNAYNPGRNRPLPYYQQPPAIERHRNQPGGTQRVQRLSLNESVPEYRMDLKINGRMMEGLLDTGASMTCIDYDYFNREFGHEVDLLAPEGLVVRGVGGLVTSTQGVARLNYEYEDKHGNVQVVELPTLVMTDSGSPLIIGRDFIDAVNLQLDTRELKIYCDRPKPRLLGPTAPKLVFGRETVEVPAKSTKMMAVYVDQGQSRPKDVIVISNIDTNTTPVAVANTLVSLGDDTLIPVTNFSQSKYTIKPDTPIAQFEECVVELSDEHEERTNQYVFSEKLKPLELSRGTVQIGNQMTEGEVSQLHTLLEEFVDVFAFNGELGDCNLMAHEINTGDAKPIHSAPYRQSHKVREAVQKQIGEWLEAGVIRPSRSPWSSPVVIVPKKDKTMRMCIDLRGVNKVTQRDVYPLPCVEDAFASLNGTMFFSSLDLNQGYMQIRMAPESIPKTAFITQDGLYEFTRMPFGLTNAPATFQRCMDVILSGLKWNQCLVYLDDIIVFGRTLSEHNENLVNVLVRIRDANLTIKPSKCAFGVEELRFLGHIVSSSGIRMDPDKISAIEDLSAPTNVTEVRSFVGAASYYRRFVEGFSKIAEPLTELTRDNVEFNWGKDQQSAFDEIKQRLTTQPILCHYNPSLPLELRTDACGYGLGAILLHVFNDGTKHVITYASRLMNKAEKNYSISEQECLAIVWAIDKFKIYLQNVRFKVVTDHLALTWLNTKKNLAGRLMRWALALQQYDFEIEYRSGRTHKDVDHLSRFPCQRIAVIRHRGTYKKHYLSDDQPEEELQDGNDDDDTTPKLTRTELIEAQSRDPFITQMIQDKNPNFEYDNGIMTFTGDDHRMSRIVIPQELLSKVLYCLHDDPLSGHCGYRKTLWKFNQRYYCKNVRKAVKKYTLTCHYCQTRKSPWTKRTGMLKPIPSAKRPFERIGIDTLGPFRRSTQGNEKVIVITDYLTKWAITRAVARENETTIAKVLIEDVFLVHGVPDVIITDRGKSFNTQLLKEIYTEFNVKHVTSTPYHPQTNGLTERFNKTLAIMMSMYVSHNHKDWDDYLPYVTFAYNSVVQDSTRYAPFYLLYGVNARMPADLIDPNQNQNPADRLERLHRARELAIEANSIAQERQKTQYDQGRYNQEFDVGDLVLVHRPRGYTGQTTKLRHPYEGPFKVLKKYSDLVYLVEEVNTARNRKVKTELVHVTRMKRYHKRGTAIARVATTQNKQSKWVQNSLWLITMTMAFSLFANIEGRIVWRRTDLPIVNGIQKVAWAAHYELPCGDDNPAYNEALRTKYNITQRFEAWCTTYTQDILTQGLSHFCSDKGTEQPGHPARALLRHQKLMQREHDQPVNFREKRWVGYIVTSIVSTVVGLATGFNIGSTSTPASGNVERTLKDNLETLKTLANENEQINRRVDALSSNLNLTINSLKEIQEQVHTLEMIASIENQALIATIVSKFTNLAEDLREAGDKWAKGEIAASLLRNFGFDDKCLQSTCPIELYKPNSCTYDAVQRDLIIHLERKFVRADVEIIEADPFIYYNLPGYETRNASQTNDFWNQNPTRLTATISSYIGPNLMASSRLGCINRVAPEQPRKTDIPVVLDGCMSEAEITQALRYSDWKELDITPSELDVKSVQMKTEGNTLILLCYPQRYEVQGQTKECPKTIVTLPSNVNVTVYRHPMRTPVTPILTYTYGSIQNQTSTKFNLPEDLRWISPRRTKSTTPTLSEIQHNLTKAVSDSESRRRNLRYHFTEYVREHGASWMKRFAIGLGVATAIIVTLIILYGLAKTKTMLAATDPSIVTKPLQPRLPSAMAMQKVRSSSEEREPKRPPQYDSDYSSGEEAVRKHEPKDRVRIRFYE